MTVSIRDESFSGKVLHQIDIEFEKEVLSVKEIITAKVYNEVNSYNQNQTERFRGLVEPTDAEKILNGYKIAGSKLIDAEKQAYVALSAFQQNAYFVLIDNIQCESLDQVIPLTEGTTISFIKLTPLVGG